MALLNAVEHSVHFHGPSHETTSCGYFLIMTIAMHIMTAVKESGFFFTGPVTYQPQCIRLLSDLQRIWQTIWQTTRDEGIIHLQV